MHTTIHHKNTPYTCNLLHPHDLAIPLHPGEENVNCFYAPPVKISPVVAGDFIGSTAEGGAVNFKNVELNPHGNGTHTECVGHIAKEWYAINQCLREFHFVAKLITVSPAEMENGDFVIRKAQVEAAFGTAEVEAIIIRSLPNDESKCKRQYSGNNPPYFHHEAIKWLVEKGIKHLLTDLPSVDREEDGGKLLSHRAFWQYPDNIREDSTITELIYVKPEIPDGLYLLNLQIISLEMDASPSKPVIYALNANI